MSRYMLPAAMISLLLSAGGCSASAPPEGDPGGEPRVASTSEALVTINPCDPAWQLPTWARRDPSPLPVPYEPFRAFEDRLAAGGALWIGSFSLPDPYRAIVEVDVYAAATKKLKDRHLWYLAAIPIASTAALAAVGEFSDIYPVDSAVIGYCISGNAFLPKGQPLPPNHKVTHEVTQYDPRCVCDVASPTGVISVYQ